MLYGIKCINYNRVITNILVRYLTWHKPKCLFRLLVPPYSTGLSDSANCWIGNSKQWTYSNSVACFPGSIAPGVNDWASPEIERVLLKLYNWSQMIVSWMEHDDGVLVLLLAYVKVACGMEYVMNWWMYPDLQCCKVWFVCEGASADSLRIKSMGAVNTMTINVLENNVEYHSRNRSHLVHF